MLSPPLTMQHARGVLGLMLLLVEEEGGAEGGLPPEGAEEDEPEEVLQRAGQPKAIWQHQRKKDYHTAYWQRTAMVLTACMRETLQRHHHHSQLMQAQVQTLPWRRLEIWMRKHFLM